jgi:hypothetical protein
LGNKYSTKLRLRIGFEYFTLGAVALRPEKSALGGEADFFPSPFDFAQGPIEMMLLYGRSLFGR